MSSQGGYRVILDSIDTGDISGAFFQPEKYAIKRLIERNRGSGFGRVSKTGLINEIMHLDVNLRKHVVKKIQNEFGFAYPNSVFKPVSNEVEGYDFQQITVPSQQLNSGKATEFEVNFPYNSNYTFLGSQFIDFEAEAPELADPSEVPNGYVVRFWYCPKTGIRLLKDVEALSDISAFDNYNHNDVLKYENDSLPDNIYETWNRLIGHDLGTQADLYNVMSERTETITVKDGYQTGKLKQAPLSLFIPLLFSYNRNLNDKINLSSFNKHTLSIKGHFEKNELIVRAAAFNPNNLGAAPVPLTVKPLKVTRCRLVSLFSALDDVMAALNIGLYYQHYYTYTKSERYIVKESKMDLKLRAKEESLQLAVIARPKFYSDDFDLWTQFTPIKKRCYTVPIAQYDPNTLSYKVAFQGAEWMEPVNPFKYVNLIYNGIVMMSDGTKEGNGDPRLWSQVDVFSKSIRYLDYQVRRPGMIYFNFNPHVNTKKISCIYNFGKLSDSVLKFCFNSDAGINSNGSLVSDYEIITFSESLNSRISSGDSAVRVLVTG